MTISRPEWVNGWYVLPYEVTWRDLDAMGHVNNAVYFTYFEWARTKYWLDLTGGKSAGDIGFIVAHAECDFKLQLNLLEKIQIAVKIGETRNTSLDFLYEIRRQDGAELAATGKVVVVLYSWEASGKLSITEELRKGIAKFQGGG